MANVMLNHREHRCYYNTVVDMQDISDESNEAKKYEYFPRLWPRNTKKVCHDCDRSRHFTRNYVTEVYEAIVLYLVAVLSAKWG